MSQDVADDYQASAPFEGPEKLLEIWFAPSANDVPHLQNAQDHKTGLRSVSRKIWEDMLSIVQCKVLSVIDGQEMDAYLLSESSFFVSPHRVILKTCGTTLNLLGLPRILEIAAKEANLPTVYRFFYSRKSFMFPERQLEPHRGWDREVEYLDNFFDNGAAYTIGKVNGDHWLLYMTDLDNISASDSILPSHLKIQHPHTDYTIEILMSDLSPNARQLFFSDSSEGTDDNPSSQGTAISQQVGISQIFPPSETTLDAYAFQPCGYSANALIKRAPKCLKNGLVHKTTSGLQQPELHGEGYYTIHVTPEEGWSYASFECNIPLSSYSTSNHENFPDVKSLVKRVVNIFEPGRITLTLFMSSENNDTGTAIAIDAAQRAFKDALTESACPGKQNGIDEMGRVYKRTDKINYEFGGYDLAFASFELK